jgi:hypothetical protein
MFGLEKKPKARFEFDLEKDLKSDPQKLTALIKTVDGKVNDIKQILRQGGSSASFDQFGILLHGYAALQRVLNRMNKK